MNQQNLKLQAFVRDLGTCQTCMDKATEIHHIIPRRSGGLDILENITSVCRKCHILLEFVKYRPKRDASIERKIIRIKEDTYEHLERHGGETFDDAIRRLLKLPARVTP